MNSDNGVVVSFKDQEADEFLLGTFTKPLLPDTGTQKHVNTNRIALKSMKSVREREAAVVRDLLYVLLGYEGIYVKYSNGNHMNDPEDSLKGPAYITNKDIDIAFKDTTKQLCILGKYYSALSFFVGYFNKSCYGKVMSRLCEYIRNFLHEYHSLVCQLYDRFYGDRTFSIISLYQKLQNISNDSTYPSVSECMHQLYQLAQSIVQENQKRLKNSNLLMMKFENIMKSLKEDMSSNIFDDIMIDSQNSKYVKGGVVLNMIQKQLENFRGNDRNYAFFSDMIDSISVEYIDMLNMWLQYGKIDDQFEEFFITEVKSDSNVSRYNTYYWMNKYAIKVEGLLEQFSTVTCQKQIFLTGKYLAIINECKFDNIIDNCQFNPIVSFQHKNLELIINEAYVRSNNLILQLFYSGYELPSFIKLMNKHFLLTDGSLVDKFLNEANHELKRSFNNTSTSHIKRSYDSSYVLETNNQVEKLISDSLETKFENHSALQDILEIIKTQVTNANDILNSSNLGTLSELLQENVKSNLQSFSSTKWKGLKHQRCNKLAISRFNIDIQIPFPLNQVILDSQKLEYQILFRHSILVKFIEKRFEKSWRELGYQTFWTWNYEDDRVKKWIKRCRFIHTKMFDFLRIYLLYSKYDVIESNWKIVEKILHNVSENEFTYFELSSLKFQLTEFLSSSISEHLLSQADITCCLYELFTLMLVFHEYVMSMRKSLLLMDESLLNHHKDRLNLSIDFDSAEKEAKLKTVIEILDSYHIAFNQKMSQLCEYLVYYGEIDSPKMSLLYSKLVATFNL